ncbi:MAG: hypothetical protein CL554_20195 [Algoriphagus sp.]|uniref:formyltransferase family protein n=1 Tax=Algoriphagus sp. TaxID=1872435 RepID=UPI000C4F44E2|nr:formyltransferase family protein [Algoriphagus sp.]MAL15731.1 hypothetical protein [Algoriphagus sp.]
MVKNDSIIKVAVTGNTLLTLKAMQRIVNLDNYKILHVFGINSENMKNKVNSVDLSAFCSKNNISLNKTENWDSFYTDCIETKVDLVITLGDSRIIPKKIIDSFRVIGNHGAVLPGIQGGASLVWGRMLNAGSWGISIMNIDEKVDSGDILKVKSFLYDKDTSEQEFVTMSDNLTVEALLEVLAGNYSIVKNEKWRVRVAKHTDSKKAIDVLKFCVENNIPVYMPSRTPSDAKVSKEWPDKFTSIFKIANNNPYPAWTEEI